MKEYIENRSVKEELLKEMRKRGEEVTEAIENEIEVLKERLNLNQEKLDAIQADLQKAQVRRVWDGMLDLKLGAGRV